MARAPRARAAARPAAGEPELEDDEEIQNAGQGDAGEGDQTGDGEEDPTEGAPLDPGTEQAPGDGGDLGDEDDEDDEDDQPGAAAGSRGSNRLQRLANDNRVLRDRINDFERRLTQPTAPAVPQEESDEAFNARVVLLPPDERMEARQARSDRRTQGFLRQMQFQTQEATDKAGFDAKAAVDPRYQRWSGEVERKRNELIQQGQIVPREVVLKFLIGERVLANQGSKEVRRAKNQGAARVRSQVTRPTDSRGDVAGTRRGGLSEAEKRKQRLENQQI